MMYNKKLVIEKIRQIIIINNEYELTLLNLDTLSLVIFIIDKLIKDIHLK